MKTDVETMNERLERAGVATIRPEEGDIMTPVYLEYEGKKIPRPSVQRCMDACKKEFNLNI